MTAPDTDPFELPPVAYDALIDWPRRLGREGSFFKQHFEAAQARSVVDLACGTGRHAALFHTWGLAVTGIDASSAMIDFCRRTHGEQPTLQWDVCRFEQLARVAGPFDAAICVGNSLAQLLDVATVAATVQQIARLVRRGGVCILHVLNYGALPDGPVQWQKARTITLGDEQRLIVKGVHRAGTHGFVDVVDVNPADPERAPRLRSKPMLALSAAELQAACTAAGFTTCTAYGDHAGAPHDPQQSTDVLLVARRA